jgi:hypothetical protein
MANKLTTWNKKQASNLKKILEPITKRLNRIVSVIATTREKTNTFWTKLQREIKKVYRNAQLKSKDWTNETVPLGYRKSARQYIYKIKKKKMVKVQSVEVDNIIVIPNDFNYYNFINKDMSRQSMQSLVEDTLSSFFTGFLSGEKTIIRLARTTQQSNLSESQIEQAIKEGNIETGSVQGSVKRLKNELLEKAIDGKYITITDKNGKQRNYRVDTYAEMVARTKLNEASSQAALNAASVAGTDLVQISSHNTNCEICAPFEGKIYSISGNNKDFPKLDEAPPYHPNCLHILTPVFEEGLEADGTYDKYSDFSKGITSQHPTRKSWIPLSERELS